MQFGDHAVRGGGDGGLHLHRLHHQELVALRHLVADSDGDTRDQAWDRRADLERIREVGLGSGLGLRRDLLVRDVGLARHAVQLERHGAAAILVGLAHGNQPDDQRR